MKNNTGVPFVVFLHALNSSMLSIAWRNVGQMPQKELKKVLVCNITKLHPLTIVIKCKQFITAMREY